MKGLAPDDPSYVPLDFVAPEVGFDPLLDEAVEEAWVQLEKAGNPESVSQTDVRRIMAYRLLQFGGKTWPVEPAVAEEAARRAKIIQSREYQEGQEAKIKALMENETT